MRVELCGLGMLLALGAGPVPAAEPASSPDAELLEFLGQFAQADEEALDLALGSVADEAGIDVRRGEDRAAAAEEKDDESR